MDKELVIQDKLISLLVNSVLKSEIENEGSDIEAFRIAMHILGEEKSIFQEIPKAILLPLSRLESTEKETGCNIGLMKDIYTHKGYKNEDVIQFYPQKGLLIYDGLHGSAFGRMSYIYRSKGTRIYLFEDMTLDVLTPYCTIDHNGFNLQNESYILNPINVDFITSIDYIPEIFDFFKQLNTESIPDEHVNIPLKMIQIISNIKQPFNKDYYLEYVLLPPDVDKISDFSKKIQLLLWKICLSDSFQKKWGENLSNKAMSLLISIKILPDPILLIDFIKGHSNDDLTNILRRIDNMEQILTKKKVFSPEIKTPFGKIDLEALRQKINEFTRNIIL